jgi:8-oxo-dGTP pyrophosphatase MutT (NUDIX family)
MKWPKIRARRTTAVSPWMSILAREVEFSRGGPVATYHAVEQADYIAIVARTPGGKIAIVRQYRPALEAFAWELPAGLVDRGEKPGECARRELLEETGLTTRHSSLGRLTLHGTPQQQNSFLLHRDRHARCFLQAGARHSYQARFAGRDCAPHSRRPFPLATAYRRAPARGAARIYRAAAYCGQKTDARGAHAIETATPLS